MKLKLFTFLLSVLFAAGSLQAQVVPEFEFLPGAVSVQVPLDTNDYPAEIEIKSLSSSEIRIKWQRYVVSMTQGCQTKVCDLLACYPETFSTKDFPLGPGAEGPISVHLVKTPGQYCEGVVRLDMWNKDTEELIVPAFFYFNMPVTGTQAALQVKQVAVFPNPTTEFFTIDAIQGLDRIRMMDINGREVAAFNAAGTQVFSVADHAAGNYVLVYEGDNGAILGVSQLVKN